MWRDHDLQRREDRSAGFLSRAHELSLFTYTSVVCKNIQSLLLPHEIFDSRFDRGEVGEIDDEWFQSAFALRVCSLQLLDGGVCFTLAAPGEVNCAISLVDDLCQLFATAGVASSDYEHSASLIWEVFLGQLRFGEKEGLVPETADKRHGVDGDVAERIRKMLRSELEVDAAV